MPNRKKMTILWLLITLFFTSCMVKDSKGNINPTAPPTVSRTALATATETATPIPSSSTSTLLPIIPTLPDQEAYSLLFDMLHAGRECELPCWLNITPGSSSHGDAYHEWGSFLSLAGTTEPLPKGYLYVFNQMTNNNIISILTRYSLSSNSELIESINVSTQVLTDIGNGSREPIYTLAAYKELLNAYLLPNILSTYGEPAQILLSMEIISAEPTSPDFFNIWLLYPERGAIVRYEGSAVVKEGTIHGCPSDTFVSLWLVNPDNVKLYEDTLKDATGHSDIVTGSPYYKSTMEAVGMSAEEFYEVLKDPTERCIESPLDIWPEP